MAQEHLTTFGASASRWARALAVACGAAWCVASVGCGGGDGPGVLGPGLDPPKNAVDGGASPGDFGNNNGKGGNGNGGNGANGGSGGQSAPDGVDDGHSGSGGASSASSDAAVAPPSCPSGDAGIPPGDAGVFDAGLGCEEDAAVSR